MQALSVSVRLLRVLEAPRRNGGSKGRETRPRPLAQRNVLTPPWAPARKSAAAPRRRTSHRFQPCCSKWVWDRPAPSSSAELDIALPETRLKSSVGATTDLAAAEPSRLAPRENLQSMHHHPPLLFPSESSIVRGGKSGALGDFELIYERVIS